MERTELREQFFAETRRDPWAHMVQRLYAQAWAEGYEQALRDNGLEEERYRKSFSDRMNDAIEHATSANKKAEAQMMIAFAELGSRLPSV